MGGNEYFVSQTGHSSVGEDELSLFVPICIWFNSLLLSEQMIESEQSLFINKIVNGGT